MEGRIRDYADKVLPGTDNVSNLDRILRIPGTLNWKDQSNPKPVVLLKGGLMRPTYKQSLLVRHLGDQRLDVLLASALQGQLGKSEPRIHHASGRITDSLDVFFIEALEACQAFEADERWRYRLDIVRADLPEIMRYYFG
jgi:hypothetical protein